jgi:ubiquinone/menaquinone biosynthesis C-methylase UbiE
VRRQAVIGRQPAAGPRLFDGWYGALYDIGASSRLGPFGALAMWGFDMGRVRRMMAEGIACEPGQVVLDVPTGGGLSFAAGTVQARGLVVAADISLGMLRRAGARLDGSTGGHVRLVQADASRLPLADDSADRVLCFNSLHCLPARLHQPVLAELRRVLKPGGELLGTTLVADPSGPWVASVAAARLSGIFHPPTSTGLAAAARRAGFASWRQEIQGALAYFGGE